jgi:type I restriction enzyme S subunit
MWHGPQGVVNQHIFKVIPNPEAVIKKYLYWLLKHEVRQLARSQHAHGLAMMHINRTPFLAHTVLLPPLDEQRMIVAKVDELMTLCDQFESAQDEGEARRDELRRASLRRITAGQVDKTSAVAGAWFFLQRSKRLITKPEHVTEVRHSILDLAVSGKLVPQDPTDKPATKILREIQTNSTGTRVRQGKGNLETAYDEMPHESLPTGWVWTKVGQVFLVTGGIQKQPKRTPTANAFPYLGVSNVQRGRLDLKSVARFELFPGELEKLRLETGDLLIVEGNGSANEIGRCARWNGEITDCVHQNHIIRCRPLCEDLERFVLLYLNSPSGTATMRHLAITTAGLYNLSVGKIQRITVPLPPLAEQGRIVAKVDELMSACDQLEIALKAAQAKQGQLLEALLREALGDERPIQGRSTAM